MIEDLWDTPEVQKLIEQGHDVMRLNMGTDPPYDLILGERCWRMPAALLKLLPVALKAARQTRYPKTEVVDEGA